MQKSKITNMKNAIKIGTAALIIAVAAAACDPPTGNSTTNPGDTVKKAVDTTAKSVIDTAKKDTAKK
jgi:hypothetical protein